jgi:hypothetical protein
MWNAACHTIGMTRALYGTCIGVLAWCSPALPQRPSDRDVDALIERSRQKALDYAQSLPDFVATEVIRRFTGSETLNGSWSLADTLTIQLRYFQHKEDHKLMLIDGKPTVQTFDTLEGTVGWGEFGTTLHAVFDPASQTSFHWQGWKNVRKHRASVVGYEVDGPHARYHLGTAADGRTVAADVHYHGVLDIDGETGQVLHLEYLADHIPETLNLQFAGNTVDYALADIGGRQYLLPSRSESEMRSGVNWARNVTEFREYRKFSAESTIDFGTGK